MVSAGPPSNHLDLVNGAAGFCDCGRMTIGEARAEGEDVEGEDTDEADEDSVDEADEYATATARPSKRVHPEAAARRLMTGRTRSGVARGHRDTPISMPMSASSSPLLSELERNFNDGPLKPLGWPQRVRAPSRKCRDRSLRSEATAG
jgi:hypothetical protein